MIITGSSRTGRGWLLVVVAGTLMLDIATKAFAQASLVDEVRRVGPLAFDLAYNPGVAFGMGDGAPLWMVTGFTAAITVGLSVFAWFATGRNKQPRFAAALGLLLGGAAANLFDRAADGRVTDFLSVGWWPTFNLADTSIVLGAALVIITVNERDDQNKSRYSDSPAIRRSEDV